MSKKSEDIIFALQPGSIEIDDIILTSDFGTIPFGIRKFTKSDFSHAALCTKPAMLLEAVRDGVLRRSVIGTFAPRLEWIRILRPKKPLPVNAQGLRVRDYAESLYGRAYTCRGAIASLFPILGPAEDGSVFCSQVIAQAFLDYCVSLLLGKIPSQIYPGKLLDSHELMDVTADCVRTLGSVSNPNLYKEIVDTASQELLGTEMQMNRQAFEAIRKELGDTVPEHVHLLTDLSSWLSAEFSFEAVKKSDGVILNILEREGMFEWYAKFSANVQGVAEFSNLRPRQPSSPHMSQSTPRYVRFSMI